LPGSADNPLFTDVVIVPFQLQRARLARRTGPSCDCRTFRLEGDDAAERHRPHRIRLTSASVRLDHGCNLRSRERAFLEGGRYEDERCAGWP
jgi:hypothetical protein